MQQRKWSYEEKSRIVYEAMRDGATYILKKYNISQSMLHEWQSFMTGRVVDAAHGETKTLDYLRTENAQLRKIVAKLALELDLRCEVLKNSGC